MNCLVAALGLALFSVLGAAGSTMVLVGRLAGPSGSGRLTLAQGARAGPRGAARAAEGAAVLAGKLGREEHAGTYRDGGVLGYGSARFLGSPVGAGLAAPIVSMAATPEGNGYWLAAANGAVYSFGDARYYGGLAGHQLYAPIVSMAAAPDGNGYWLAAANGAVYCFGDARCYGSPATTGGAPDPVVGIAPTPLGNGYWLATNHGAVYSFGAARYYGSLGGTDLHNIPVVAIASSANGKGYWLVQGGGEVKAYGDAPRLGGMRGQPPVVGIAVTANGQGYWLACNDGQVDAFGDAAVLGGDNRANPRPPITGIVADGEGDGYWLLDRAAFSLKPGHPGNGAGARVVKIAASQLGPSPDGANFCNPYGPCEQWCSLFATWVWERAGIPIPRYAFVGDVYYWAKRHTRVLPATQTPDPGDLVLYGTGPQSVRASPHIGVVAQVWPDGEIDTVEGDAGPGRGHWTAVLVNGPYLPSQSFFANGFPVYGYAVL